MNLTKLLESFEGRGRYLFLICFITFYFVASWALGQLFQGTSWGPYLFDLIFVISVVVFFKKRIQPGFKIEVRDLVESFLMLILLLVVALWGTYLIVMRFGHQHPFLFIDNLFVQMVIVAPLWEEVIFRHAWWTYLEKIFGNNKRKIVLFSAIIFSLSHAVALFFLPEAFRLFIIWQVVYTFFLGLSCSLVRLFSRGLFWPIVFHFIFNLSFYMALQWGII